MKIVTIVPGFGGSFYCGNCLRDSFFTKALLELNHQATVLPIYLPLKIDESNAECEIPVFYGAVNVYLKQNFSVFRKMPKFLENFFNSSAILRYAAKKAGSTRAKGLEEMTISMLRGHEGYQNEELQQLVDYLKNIEKPDIVHLSNALLLGLAKKIKEEVGCAVVCALQDEDVWIDAMSLHYIPKLWTLMQEKAKDVDAFIAVSRFFAQRMQEKMKIPTQKLFVNYIGINPEKYFYNQPATNPPTIGYLSRMNEENGFEIFVDAFIELKKNSEFKNLKLKATGGKTADDEKFFRKQINKIQKNGFLSDVEIIEDYSLQVLPEFFKNLSIISVPVLQGEAFGLYQIEALASGIPLVQPNLGAFPEIAELTKASIIYQPNTANALAAALSELLPNNEKLQEMSRNGRNAALEHFDARILTKKMVEIYQKIL